MRRLGLLALVVTVAASGCVFGGTDREAYSALFERAVQLFPGGRVRVLGVDVGLISSVKNVDDGVLVGLKIDEEVPLPADVRAAIVPASLLGERYVQLFPAYEGGARLPRGATIPVARTAVPAEPDELLRSLQDYLGALDPENVGGFVENAATILQGNGEDLNALIHQAAGVIRTLSEKRDDLAQIITSFERVARVAAGRKEKVDRLIDTYNAVVGTLTGNRTALEGTIVGLKDMSTELAALLLEHRGPLHDDIRSLTRTGRTLSRNVGAFVRTGRWAQRLFRAAERAVDFDRDWLRLNNQGQELESMIAERLMERLTDLCSNLGLPCAAPSYWRRSAPSLFCLGGACPAPEGAGDPAEELTDAIAGVPGLVDRITRRSAEEACANSDDPQACIEDYEALVGCLDAADPARCLKRHDLPPECATAANPVRCLERARRSEVQEAAEDLIDDTIGQLTGGLR